MHTARTLETGGVTDKRQAPPVPAVPQKAKETKAKPPGERVKTAVDTQKGVNAAVEPKKEKVATDLETKVAKVSADVSPELMELYLKRLEGLSIRREHLVNRSCPNNHGSLRDDVAVDITNPWRPHLAKYCRTSLSRNLVVSQQKTKKYYMKSKKGREKGVVRLKWPADPCRDLNCTASFPPPRDRLRTIVHSQYPVKEMFQQLTSKLVNQTLLHVNFTFITAASANHYNESQGLLKTLFEGVFPFLAKHTRLTYRLVYYDLGLSIQQQQQLQRRSSSVLEVVRFPVESLPQNSRKLGTCNWKPLLVKAHLPHSDATFWLDASARFTRANISAILDHVNTLGVVITRNYHRLPMHVAEPMLQYFHIEPCLLSSFYELAGGFLGFKNEQLIQRAIVDPWVSCALSPNCMCPGKDCWRLYWGCNNPNKTYSRCHRFDQSAIAVILDTLFDWRATHFVFSSPYITFRRNDLIAYLP